MAELKVKVSEAKEKEIISWLVSQIDTALQDRSPLEARWIKWINQYEEILPQKKSFPWENCSNISVPISPIAIETIHSREVNTLLNIPPYIQVRSKKKGVDPNKAPVIEKFMDQVFRNSLDFYRKGSHWLLEKNKMGTGFLKVFWDSDKKKKGKNLVSKDEANINVIDIEDLIFPINARDLQSSSFVAHRIRTDWNTLKRKEKLGIYKDVEKIKAFKEQDTEDQVSGKDVKGKKEQIEKQSRTAPDVVGEYQIHECWFNYDIDDDGYDESLVMTLHKEKQINLRFIYHPYDHARRPFIENKYMERVNRVYGKGIGEQSEHLQDGINDVFNRTIDNMTIANIKCFKGRKTARKDIGKIYPGKVFWLDDPTDLEEFLLGEVHQSNFVIHSELRDYHERRTKVTDYTLGRESNLMRSRATATGTLALLQESGRHFDLVINNSRQAMVEVAYQIIELYMQYKPEKVFAITGADNQFVDLKLPEINNLREEYEFYCAATSLSVNKEIEKQTNLLLLQQLGQLFGQMINMMMMVFSPQMKLPDEIKEYVTNVVKSYHYMAQELVRSFEKIDIDKYIPELPDIIKQAYGQDQITKFMELFGGLFGQGGTQAGPPGIEEGGGMGLPSPEMGGAEGQGAPIPAGPSTFRR